MGQLRIHGQGSARAWPVYGFLQLHHPAGTGSLYIPYFCLSLLGITPISRRDVPSLGKLPILSRPLPCSHRPLRRERKLGLSPAGRAPPVLVCTILISHACRPASAFFSGFCCFAFDAAWWWSRDAGILRSPSVDHRTAGIPVGHSAGFHSSNAPPATAASAQPPVIPWPTFRRWSPTAIASGFGIRLQRRAETRSAALDLIDRIFRLYFGSVSVVAPRSRTCASQKALYCIATPTRTLLVRAAAFRPLSRTYMYQQSVYLESSTYGHRSS